MVSTQEGWRIQEHWLAALWLCNILEPLGQTEGVPQKQADVYFYLHSIRSVLLCFGYLPAEGCGVLLGT